MACSSLALHVAAIEGIFQPGGTTYNIEHYLHLSDMLQKEGTHTHLEQMSVQHMSH
jgi:hypothetical protein